MIKDVGEFRKEAHKMVDRLADYYENVESYPVKSQINPGDVSRMIPHNPPQEAEGIDAIMSDFDKYIMPGLVHWQHPAFFAYFPANSSYPSVLAEMLTATIAQQGMVWETSPAAAELEEKMMEWLKDICGLPVQFTGVIQDTASASTLTALLTARERSTQFTVNHVGFNAAPKLRIYCTSETHSSIEKAARIAGFGSSNLVKIPVDDQFAMIPEKLEEAILKDTRNGFEPCCIIGTIGTTSCTAVDPIEAIGTISKKFNIWFHVDGAYAGTAMVLSEMHHYAKGLEFADSYVFNPHKWMFTNFDCSAYFVKDKESLIKTFEILPEYLKTGSRGKVNDYRDWGVALGRRFRALKLWFVIRNFGIKGIQEKVRLHLDLAQWLTNQIKDNSDFELLTETRFSLVCFRYKPKGINDENQLNEMNKALEAKLNSSGKLYISHTILKGKYTLRLVIAQTYVEPKHVFEAWDFIKESASKQ